MRTLVIFDIDGTLTDTKAIDDTCYGAAMAEAFGLTASDVVWDDAPHMTDSGIARWLWEKHRGRAPTSAELAGVKRRFVELLSDALAAAPHHFAAVAGAAAILPRLRAHGWSVAFATGGWGESARLKLTTAEISHSEIAFASSDDAATREEIVTLARQRAESGAGHEFERVVSVGDGVWDVQTARTLGLPFVGIGVGDQAARLTAAGAGAVLAHLENWSDVIATFATATVPIGPR